MNITILQHNFSLPKIIGEMSMRGATSIPLINEEVRKHLITEARSLRYHIQSEYMPSGVRQQLSACEQVPKNGPCARVAILLESLILEQASHISPYPFSQPFVFNDIVLQQYPKHSTGISPHRDFSDRINLVGVLVLEGHGRFGICRDRTGIDIDHIPGEPGDLILMRAPGFLGSDIRPIHQIDSITSERFILGMRCKKQ